ncbi:MAG TPA: DUF1801 domain-containing protein [Rhizomicrobium sp.]|jgi:uncharacterized protein YdhG (YjbR/CyaY superfamily)|nr:DUF1801 domain-containing protein [Rhizomicrobium sp.]
MKSGPVAKDVDAYLKTASAVARPKLAQLRAIVKAAAPGAEETIRYGMPFYTYEGARIGFAAYKDHIGFYPGAAVADFKAELAGYSTANGTVRLSLEDRLPVALVKALVKASLKRNQIKARKRAIAKR